MSKKFFATLIVAVVATFAGYNIYQSQRTVTMSDLALANVEALANGEIEGTNCEGTWNQECCVCFGLHHTYARPQTSTGACEHRTNCSHYN
ncbi:MULTISPECIES: NVEALA domain-containing protein [Bacteroides]|uniref:NVEALA domain-containing protein n=1 Tax=Bacteroides TaxID=816 RepID=UPI0009436510|nr:NVEALA domain-containing protein [Bacteroides neonati]